jgi:hypothetical protein
MVHNLYLEDTGYKSGVATKNIKIRTYWRHTMFHKQIKRKYMKFLGSRAVGMVMGYELDGRGSIPGRGKIIFSIGSRPLLRPIHPPIQWVPGDLSPGVKRLGREADHSPPPSSEVKNGRSIPPLPICLHDTVLNYLSKRKTLHEIPQKLV